MPLVIAKKCYSFGPSSHVKGARQRFQSHAGMPRRHRQPALAQLHPRECPDVLQAVGGSHHPLPAGESLTDRDWRLPTNETRLGDLLDFVQLFKAFGNNEFAQISYI